MNIISPLWTILRIGWHWKPNLFRQAAFGFPSGWKKPRTLNNGQIQSRGFVTNHRLMYLSAEEERMNALSLSLQRQWVPEHTVRRHIGAS